MHEYCGTSPVDDNDDILSIGTKPLVGMYTIMNSRGRNHSMAKIMCIAIMLLMFTGCANTRDPNPVMMKQANDLNLVCHEIAVAYKSNTEVATAKIAKNDDDDVQDFIVGALVWPGLADFKNADGTEGNALLDRNIRLLALAKEIDCDTVDFPPQPVRYD